MTILDSNTDNRMRWIRELERRKALTEISDFTRYFETHEFVSECEISGFLDYDGGLLSCWWTGGNSYLPSLQTFALKLDLPTAEEIKRSTEGDPIFTAAEDGYHSRSIEDELISLLSVWLHTRFFLVQCTVGEVSRTSISRRHGDPFTYPACKNNSQKKSNLFKGTSKKVKKNVASAKAMLDAVRRLSTNQHRQFYLACSHYADAVRLIGYENEIAYIRLVSAIEVLAYSEKLENDELPEKLKSIIKNNKDFFSGTENVELLSFLKQRKIGFKFVQFLIKNSEGYFEGHPTTPDNAWVTAATLGEYAKAIYKARSRFLHEGEPLLMPEEYNIKKTDERGCDLGIGVPFLRDQRKFTPTEKIPTVLFFEELVRHCLLNYLGVFPRERL